jgi:hypothetical protein
MMDELSLIPFAFSAYYVIYYLRAVWRVYRSHLRRSATTTSRYMAAFLAQPRDSKGRA